VASPKRFDETEVLEKAMNAFWLRGYSALGMSELTREMGISRQSLYDTFGSKRELFIRAIEHYRGNHLARALSLLSRGGSDLDNVRAVVGFFADLALDERCRGCLVANALVELGPHDEEIAQLLEETLGLLQSGVLEALERAREKGELSGDVPPRVLAQALTNSMIGMAVTGKLRRGADAIHGAYSGALSLLG
jgi:TetR/AcrR family transcriptional repressor of nem operon